MVRLSPPRPDPIKPGEDSLICDNYLDCGEFLRYGGVQGFDRARAKGWHIFQGPEQLFLLGPQCVGMRFRLPPAPPVLPGQEELF
jgi:hypothetical protein